MSDSFSPPSHTGRRRVFSIGVVWAMLVGWSLLRIPIPGINEPNYLCKAKHWWNPSWCAGDFFLNSANPHLVFYATWGWLTQVASLPTAAILGRIAGLLVLACGWQRFTQSLTSRRWVGPLSMILFLALQSLGNFAGEWLVGGIEGKVPAYGFLFWSIGNLLLNRPVSAAFLAGLAVSFHPLVGLWGVIAAGMASLFCIVLDRTRFLPIEDEPSCCMPVPETKTLLLMAVFFTIAALPGLVPALGTLQSSDPTTERIATQLQVADRLSHHLDPMQFEKSSYRYWGMMLVLWLVLQRKLPIDARERWWCAFVLSSVLIVGIGILIGWGPRPIQQMIGYEWRSRLLKFYFFRLGDLLVPIALSLAVVRAGLRGRDSARNRRLANVSVLLGLLAASIGALTIPFPDGNPSRLTPAQHRDWVAACDWIEQNTPLEALTYVTDSGWAIKWYAQRPEYVNYKDMPQDAASVVEWNRRLWVIANWRIAVAADGEISESELDELGRSTGIRYLICSRFGPMTVEPTYENETFRIYELPVE